MYRTALTRFLIFCLCVQSLTPPVLATPSRTSPVVAAISNAPAHAGSMALPVLAQHHQLHSGSAAAASGRWLSGTVFSSGRSAERWSR